MTAQETVETPTDVDPEVLGGLFMELHHRVYRQVSDIMTGECVSIARFKLLMKLHMYGPSNQAALAGWLGLAPRSVTETVDALERDGLVTRSEDANDRRARIVALTDEGRDAYTSGAVTRSKALNEIFGSLTAAQRVQLSDLLGTIRSTITTGESL